MINVASEPSKNTARITTGKSQRGSFGFCGRAFTKRSSGGSFLNFLWKASDTLNTARSGNIRAGAQELAG
jgi:hypothetical protein